jgi:hypothetical protein
MDFRQSSTPGILAHENYAQKFLLRFAADAAHVHYTDRTFNVLEGNESCGVYGAHKFRGKMKIS